MKLSEILDEIVPVLVTFEYQLCQNGMCGHRDDFGYEDTYKNRVPTECQGVLLHYIRVRVRQHDNSSHILRDALVEHTKYCDYTSSQELYQCIHENYKHVGDEGCWSLFLYHNLNYLQETMYEWSSLIKMERPSFQDHTPAKLDEVPAEQQLHSKEETVMSNETTTTINFSEIIKAKMIAKLADGKDIDPSKFLLVQKLSNGEQLDISDIMKLKIQGKLQEELMKTADCNDDFSIEKLMNIQMMQKFMESGSVDLSELISMKLQIKLQTELLDDKDENFDIQKFMKFQLMQDLMSGKKVDLNQVMMSKYLEKLI